MDSNKEEPKQPKAKKPKASKRKDESEFEETSESDGSYIEDDDEEETSDDEDDNSNEDNENSSANEDNDDDDDEVEDADDLLASSNELNDITEALSVLENHADASTENALVLNQNLQEMLVTLRNKVISMLNKCRETYVENQTKAIQPTFVSLLKGIGSCGAPFFKDSRGRGCPLNADYVHRSEVEKEFFPADLEYYPHFVWTATDKLGILQGIKEQAIEHMERKSSYPSTSKKSSSSLSKNVKLHTQKLADLLKVVDSDFKIDWNQISVYNLKSRHTANSCLAIWNVYLKPEINRAEWSDEENIKLNELAKKYKFQDWVAIASEMKGRSDYQCFVQYQTVVAFNLREARNERWTKEEDEHLLALVEQHRVGTAIRWNPICSQFPNRSKKQCFARYKYSLDPNIKRVPFTPEEDCIILAAVEEYGENFVCFPRVLFPNRSVIQIRNRYFNSIKVRETIRCWTPEDDKLLLDLVAEHGSHDWRKISDIIKVHSRTSCRTRFHVISRFLSDNPKASVDDLPRKRRRPVSDVTKSNWMNKIAEIKQNPEAAASETVSRPPAKELYRMKLRNNELIWYNFLKFSYDYTFGKCFNKIPNSMKSLEFVRTAFNMDLKLPVRLSAAHHNGAVRVNLEKLANMRAEENHFFVSDTPHVGYKLPPSYCSLLAFRALCIHTSFEEATEESTATVKDSDAVSEAKRKFRQRLVAVLYKTTLLSRLEPSSVIEQTHFNVLFNPNTRLGRIVSRSLAELKATQANKMAKNLLIVEEKAKRKAEMEADPTLFAKRKKAKLAPPK